MKKLTLSVLAIGGVASAFGQTISVTNFATGYSQDFNTLLSLGSAPLTSGAGGEFNNGTGATLPGWYYAQTAGTTGSYSLNADSGAGGTGTFYSYGVALAGDRALGSVASGTSGNLSYGARLVNNTGTSTGLAVLQFDLEQWRDNANATQQGLLLTYQLRKAGSPAYSQANFRTGTGYISSNMFIQTTSTSDIAMTSLTAPAPGNSVLAPIATGGSGSLVGNTPANSVRVRALIELNAAGLSWDNGDEITFRFTDVNDGGTDHGMGIDNVKVVPEPASVLAMGLGIVAMISRRRAKK